MQYENSAHIPYNIVGPMVGLEVGEGDGEFVVGSGVVGDDDGNSVVGWYVVGSYVVGDLDGEFVVGSCVVGDVDGLLVVGWYVVGEALGDAVGGNSTPIHAFQY